MSRQKYQYGTLEADRNDIRLVILQPDLGSGELQCEIKTFALDSLPPYEALSYVWGNLSAREKVIVDGNNLYVTANLNRALQSLRLKTPRKMWIDAICVDQENLDERSSQVQLMRYIFQHASRVIVYLGEPTEGSRASFKLIRDVNVNDEFLIYTNDQRGVAELDRICRTLLSKSSLQGFLNLSLDIGLRPWFQRVWVVQEVLVANDVVLQCGKDMVSWNSFIQLISAIMVLGNRLPCHDEYDDGRMQQIVIRFRPERKLLQWEIAQLVHQNRGLGATDPRDNVYALLGLSADKESMNSLFQPSYSNDVTKLDVYMMVMKHYMSKHSCLDLICTQSRYDLPVDWPSWLPDWSAIERIAPSTYAADSFVDFINGASLTAKPLFDFPTYQKFLHWNSCNSTSAQASILSSPPTLVAKGIYIDTIRDLGKAYDLTDETTTQQTLDWLTCRLRDWELVFLKHYGNPKTSEGKTVFDITDQCFKLYKSVKVENETFSLTFWRVLYTLGSLPVGLLQRVARTEMAKEYAQGSLSKERGSSSNLSSDANYVGGGNVVEAYLKTLFKDTYFHCPRGDVEARKLFMTSKKWAKAFAGHRDDFGGAVNNFRMGVLHRQFLVTEKGYMGTAPYKAMKGDMLVVLYGCSVPILLRKADDHYVFCGECYVQGLMDGEAVKGMESRKFEEREFTIR